MKRLLQLIIAKRVFDIDPDDGQDFILKSDLDNILKDDSDDSRAIKKLMSNDLDIERIKDQEEDKFNRLISALPKSIDEKNRTVEFVIATDSPVRVIDWDLLEYVDQVLTFKKRNIILDRFKSGAPFLNSHRTSDISDQIGVIEDSWIEENSLIIRVKFSKREEVSWIFDDIKDGILRNVSVGFRVLESKIEKQEGTEIKVQRVTKWMPLEGSIVTIGADPKAQARSKQEEKLIVDTKDNQNNNKLTDNGNKNKLQRGFKMFEFDKDGNWCERLEDGTLKIVRKAAEFIQTQDATISDEERKLIVENERKRVSEISRIFEIAKVSKEDTEKFVNEGKSLEDARAFVIENLAKTDESQSIKPSIAIVGNENAKAKRSLMADAMLARGEAQNVEIAADSKLYRGLSLVRMAELSLREQNIDTSLMSEREIAKRAMHTSSDFPLILQDAINKGLRAAYMAEAQTYEPIARKRSAKDFKSIHSLQMGGAIVLEKVLESGEYKEDTLKESEEKYNVEKYGKKIIVSEETIINDDLNAFIRLPQFYGESARRLENKLIWGQITSNPTMSDGVALFHANHGNLASASAIAIASLGELRKLIRLQKGLSTEQLNTMMKWLIVPAALETVAEQYITQITALGDNAKANPFAGKLGLIVEPLLDASSTSIWYGAADKSKMPSVEWAVLEGMENGPEITSWVDNDRDGLITKIKYTLAAKAVEYRGIARNG